MPAGVDRCQPEPFPVQVVRQVRLVGEVDQALLAEELAVGVTGLGDPVGVHQQPVAGLELFVPDTDLKAAAARWPRFIAILAGRGPYHSVHALPLRLRGQAITGISRA